MVWTCNFVVTLGAYCSLLILISLNFSNFSVFFKPSGEFSQIKDMKSLVQSLACSKHSVKDKIVAATMTLHLLVHTLSGTDDICHCPQGEMETE